MCRYSKDKPRLGDTLEIIKFLCKDFWQAVFKKQVDNLKTNHRVRHGDWQPAARLTSMGMAGPEKACTHRAAGCSE